MLKRAVPKIPGKSRIRKIKTVVEAGLKEDAPEADKAILLAIYVPNKESDASALKK